MVIEKPWPDCGCPLSINFKPATYDRVPFPHSCGISKDEYHRHYICDHEVYLTLSVSKINTTTGQWVATRLKEGRLFVIRGPTRPKPKKKVPAWKVHLRPLSGKRKNSIRISLISREVFPGVNQIIPQILLSCMMIPANHPTQPRRDNISPTSCRFSHNLPF